MKKFSTLLLVSLLSGTVTLGAYKVLFDGNGYFSQDKNSGITTVANSYGKKVGYQQRYLILQKLLRKQSIVLFT